MSIDWEDFQSYLSTHLGLDDSSIRGVLLRTRIFFDWLQTKNIPTSKRGVEAFLFDLRNKKYSNNTVNSYLFSLKNLEKYYTSRGTPIELSTEIKTLPKKAKAIILLSNIEIESILSTHLTYGTFHGKDVSFLDERYLILTRFLIVTGCRFSEAQLLKIRNVDLSREVVMFEDTKNDTNREAFISQPLLNMLKTLLQGKDQNDYVFQNAAGGFIHPQDYTLDLRNRAKKAGITKRVHPHLFRHCFASELHNMGTDTADLKEILGHKDIESTIGYIHIGEERLRSCVKRHRLIRKYISPQEKIHYIYEQLKTLELDRDTDLHYRIDQSDSSLRFEVYIK